MRPVGYLARLLAGSNKTESLAPMVPMSARLLTIDSSTVLHIVLESALHSWLRTVQAVLKEIAQVQHSGETSQIYQIEVACTHDAVTASINGRFDARSKFLSRMRMAPPKVSRPTES